MFWFEHNSSRIYYEEQGNGAPVLVLPGFAGSIEEFVALREARWQRATGSSLPTSPGSGRSEPQPRAYPATYFEDDARSFAALLQHLAVGPAHLMGFSDGGEISLLMAALQPGVARSVVTWGAAGALDDPRRAPGGGDVQRGGPSHPDRLPQAPVRIVEHARRAPGDDRACDTRLSAAISKEISPPSLKPIRCAGPTARCWSSAANERASSSK